MSFIYEAYCSVCGSKVEISRAAIDSGQDIIIDIEPCSTCIKDAVDEAVEKAKEITDT